MKTLKELKQEMEAAWVARDAAWAAACAAWDAYHKKLKEIENEQDT